jgi:large repetitive protein
MSKACAFLLALSLCVFLPSEGQTSRKPMITGPVDSGATVVLAGSRHQLAQPRFDVGAVDPGLKMTRVVLALAPAKEMQDQLQALLNHQQDRTSADFHRWLTPEEFGQKFGPAPEDILAIKAWLEQQGLQVTAVAKSGLWMEFTGTSGQVERAFQTQMRQYKVAGEMHIANASDLSIPAALAPVVQGVVSLHNFFKKPLIGRHSQARSNGDGTYTPISPNINLGPGGAVHALVPGDYANIYDLNPLYLAAPTPLNGSGIQIGLVARSDIDTTDYAGFRSLAALPPGNITNVLTFPPDPGFDPTSGDSLEATLDAQWSGGVAQGANIQVIVSASTATTDGVDLSAAYAVDHNLTDVLSVSFGQCEALLGAAENVFINSLWQQASAQGMSVFVSAGDNGAAGCDAAEGTTAATHGLAVSGLASTPFNTAVGGSQFVDPNPATFWAATNNPIGEVSALGYIPETVWNESCNPNTLNSPCVGQGFFLDSGSGGKSTLYGKPAWQVGFPTPADTSRDIPDVSLSAAGHDGYVLCFGGSCAAGLVDVVGGTSASSPSFAGIMAIVDQALGGRQGLANYALYRLAKGTSAVCSSSARTNPATPAPAGCIFNDVTTGNNSVPGLTGFSAVSGFDLATGLGSVNAANLVTAWKALASATTSTTLSSSLGNPISVAHGTAVNLTINVTGPSAPAPSGAVALVSSLTGPVGSVDLTSPAAGASSAFTGTVNSLPGGNYSLTAHYPGDSVNGPSDSAPISITIAPETSTTSIIVFNTTAAASSFSYGSFMELHSAIGPSTHGVATGSVAYKDAGNLLSSAPVNPKGEADLFIFPGTTPAPLLPGPHTLTATYSGDPSFNGSASATETITITKGIPTVALSSAASFVAGQSGTLTASINPTGPVNPTGTVQLLDGGVALGAPVTIPPGSTQVSLPVTFQTGGAHSVTASYSGDTTYNAAVSPALAITVSGLFSFAGTTSATVAAGQAATYNLSAAAATGFSGTVALTCSGAPAGTTCSISPASVTLSSTATSVPFTVTVATTTSAALHKLPFRGLPIVFGMIFAIAISLKSGRKQRWQFGAVAILVLGMSSCGGGSPSVPTPPPTPPATQATIVVTGTSGTVVSTVNLSLTINH